MTLFQVRATELSIDECYRAVESDAQGAVALFVGRVRNENQGQAITLLEYEAYPTMAEKEMRLIADELTAASPGVRLACTHRIGALNIGDIAVVCAVSSPHRDQAFQICRQFIDLIKSRVPIWKREHGPTGPYWVGWQDAR
jgi:molybdopterin synthase catalytic subunit